jgi:8-oxo-dGTP pyrophosphatase MutT (NUDIX family)
MSVRAFSAGIVVVRQVDHDWRYLVLRSFRNWDFPKGLVEAGEAPLAAALRETAEETSLTDLAFDWGEVFRETAPYAGGKVARYYLARLRSGVAHLPVSAELGRPEHDEFRWVDGAQAARLLPPRLQPVFAWARALVQRAG